MNHKRYKYIRAFLTLTLNWVQWSALWCAALLNVKVAVGRRLNSEMVRRHENAVMAVFSTYQCPYVTTVKMWNVRVSIQQALLCLKILTGSRHLYARTLLCRWEKLPVYVWGEWSAEERRNRISLRPTRCEIKANVFHRRGRVGWHQRYVRQRTFRSFVIKTSTESFCLKCTILWGSEGLLVRLCIIVSEYSNKEVNLKYRKKSISYESSYENNCKILWDFKDYCSDFIWLANGHIALKA